MFCYTCFSSVVSQHVAVQGLPLVLNYNQLGPVHVYSTHEHQPTGLNHAGLLLN